jgi:hypothetical protein
VSLLVDRRTERYKAVEMYLIVEFIFPRAFTGTVWVNIFHANTISAIVFYSSFNGALCVSNKILNVRKEFGRRRWWPK